MKIKADMMLKVFNFMTGFCVIQSSQGP